MYHFPGQYARYSEEKTSLTRNQAVKVCGGHAADQAAFRSFPQQLQQSGVDTAPAEQRAEILRGPRATDLIGEAALAFQDRAIHFK